MSAINLKKRQEMAIPLVIQSRDSYAMTSISNYLKAKVGFPELTQMNQALRNVGCHELN